MIVEKNYERLQVGDCKKSRTHYHIVRLAYLIYNSLIKEDYLKNLEVNQDNANNCNYY